MCDEIVAIDGPSGSGKSTVARVLADRLGFLYIDTGAMYRAAALRATEEVVGPDDDAALRAMCDALVIRLTREGGGGLRVILNGRDVSRAIRTPAMSLAASRFSALPPVREAMVRLQREMGRAGQVVMEGRDIGTVVFPGARYKFFLTASDEVRARRRFDELKRRKMEASFEDVLADLRARDRADIGRSHSPLRRADDAVEIDTSPLTVEQVVQVCLDQIHRVRGL